MRTFHPSQNLHTHGSKLGGRRGHLQLSPAKLGTCANAHKQRHTQNETLDVVEGAGVSLDPSCARRLPPAAMLHGTSTPRRPTLCPSLARVRARRRAIEDGALPPIECFCLAGLCLRRCVRKPGLEASRSTRAPPRSNHPRGAT